MISFADLVDRALEVAIAPSYTRLGPDVRSRLDHWVPIDRYDASGRVFVVTGATSGLGRAAAQALAGDGATVVILARDAAKADRVAGEIRVAAPGASVDHVVADMSDLASVTVAAGEIATRYEVVDGLIHNAGALDASFAKSPQGFERTVAAQVLGPFLLTQLLLGPLRSSSAGRIIWVASGGMYSQPLSVDHLEMTPADYNGTMAYARSKRAQVTISEMWAERLRPDGITVHAMHPGWADTPGVAKSLPTFRRLTGPLLRTPVQGADTAVWLAVDPGPPLATTGRFWLDRRPRPIHLLPSTRRSDTPAERDRLWAWCAEQTDPFSLGA